MSLDADNSARGCECENFTQHHKGTGFGPVSNEEVLGYAVFRGTAHNEEKARVTAESFDRARLKRSDLSIARLGYTTADTFESAVIAPATNKMGEFIGIACAVTADLRSIPASDKSNSLPTELSPLIQAFCVIDRVEEGDHEGHASLGYSDHLAAILDRMSAKRRGIVTNLLLAALASKFHPLQDLRTALPIQPLTPKN